MKNLIDFIVAVALMVVSVFAFPGVVSSGAAESEFIVVSCVAISDTELMNIESGFIYSGFENLEMYKYYRCAAFNAESESDIDIFDFDLWDVYLKDITNYQHDLSRVDICKKYDDTHIITSDNNIWEIDVYNFLDDNNYYYVFFDKCNTDNNIYDDVIIYFMNISDFDIELYEINKMYISEVKEG